MSNSLDPDQDQSVSNLFAKVISCQNGPWSALLSYDMSLHCGHLFKESFSYFSYFDCILFQITRSNLDLQKIERDLRDELSSKSSIIYSLNNFFILIMQLASIALSFNGFIFFLFMCSPANPIRE